MHIYKMTTENNGCITGIQEIYTLDHAAWIEGYTVEEEAVALEILADLEKFSNLHWYDIDNDLILDRPLIETQPNKLVIVADTIDSITIPGLPIPCKVIIEDKEYLMADSEDTTFEFTTDTAGTYQIKIEQFPYISVELEVTAI